MLVNFFTPRLCRAAQVASLRELSAIQSEEINLACLKRPIQEEIVQYATILIEHNFKGIHAVVRRDSVKAVVSEQLDNHQWYLTGKCFLTDDVTRLTTAFMDIIKEDVVQLHLKVVSDDACSKFHTDRYDLRLLCTYIGKGTEWVEDAYVNRAKLMNGENHQIIKNEFKIQHMQPFEVGVLKGEGSSKNKNKGIVHRSPPVSHAGEKRLLLRLDY